MGIFFPDEPDYFPNQRPTGFKRYSQVLERDWKRLVLVNLITMFWLLPRRSSPWACPSGRQKHFART